ncbi:MAG: hypothetical protein P1S60_11490, partial [Anaerolineae bacterium]|nr:hypothetical protein [Anaerolineae bacterium]
MNAQIVMPFSDPKGIMSSHLLRIQPDLQHLFEKTILSIPPETQKHQPELVASMQNDPFFDLLILPKKLHIGAQFKVLYKYAAEVTSKDVPLHLCYPDRVAFALQSEYRAQFMKDIKRLDLTDTPLIFQRSTQAWETHPQNYVILEGLVTSLGEILFGRKLDYAWCHLVIKAQSLAKIIKKVTCPSIAMVAELILQLQDQINTEDVDWLAWEDPFIFGRDATQLKCERENS